MNARTVLKGRGKEEPLVFVCSRIPDEEMISRRIIIRYKKKKKKKKKEKTRT